MGLFKNFHEEDTMTQPPSQLGGHPLMRVHSANVLSEGLRIGEEASDELKGKDQTNKARFDVY
jgi:hypothetical protein